MHAIYAHGDLFIILSLSILTTIFPGEPGLAGFIGVKDDGSDVTSGTEKSRMSTYYQLIC